MSTFLQNALERGMGETVEEHQARQIKCLMRATGVLAALLAEHPESQDLNALNRMMSDDAQGLTVEEKLRWRRSRDGVTGRPLGAGNRPS